MAEQTKAAVANTANAIAAEAKQNCMGKLADSILTEITNDGLCAKVTANDPDAVFVEYGATIPAIYAEKAKALHWVEDGKDVFAKSARAHKNVPKPFLNPAAEANRQNFIDSILD